MPAFVDAVNASPSGDVATLVLGEYQYPCGLRLTEASINHIGSGHWSVTVEATAILAAAHNVHHNQTGGSHNPTATLYFLSQNSQVISATCSCLYEEPN